MEKFNHKFEPESFAFNPAEDIAEVEQTGYIDLVDAFENHAIPADLSADDVSFNGIEEPDSILGRPRDRFDSMRMKSAILSYKPDDNAPSGE